MRISIAIPTRERAQYLRSLLATCSAIEDDNLEFVVSDNASEDNTREVVKLRRRAHPLSQHRPPSLDAAELRERHQRDNR